MYLQRKEDWIGTHTKPILEHAFEDVLEVDLRCQCVSMVDHGLAILAVPAIKLNALHSSFEGVDIGLKRRFAGELV
jgi:hypothetical protein